MPEIVERLLAALIILAFLVLLIVMAWPDAPAGSKQAASMAGSTPAKVEKSQGRAAPSYKSSGAVRAVPAGPVVVLERTDYQRPCRDSGRGDCDDEPPQYDNYGYEIPRRGGCREDAPCYCDDSWRPYWAWPRRGGCR